MRKFALMMIAGLTICVACGADADNPAAPGAGSPDATAGGSSGVVGDGGPPSTTAGMDAGEDGEAGHDAGRDADAGETLSVYPGTTLRFHPGHYMLLSVNDSVSKVAGGRAFVEELARHQRLAGIATRYLWSDLEPRKGEYDFSKIEADLEALRRQAPGKHYMVQIMDATFNDETPNPVPSYLFTAEYDGGFSVREHPTGGSAGVIAKRWNARVSERFQALLRALGAAFGDEPLLEAVRTEETAYSHLDPADEAAYFAHWKRTVDTLADSFPKTVTGVFTNFLRGRGEGGRFHLDLLTDHARSRHVAIGGPDLIPRLPSSDPTEKQPPDGYQWFPRHIGHAPLMVDVQTPEYTGGGGGGGSGGPYSSAEMLAFGIDPLKLSYIVWVNTTGYTHPQLKDRWAETIAAIDDPRFAGFPVPPPAAAAAP